MGVERVFRISKGTLEMYPMFHFTERRIEAHVCTCFIDYMWYVAEIWHERERTNLNGRMLLFWCWLFVLLIPLGVPPILRLFGWMIGLAIVIPLCFLPDLFCKLRYTAGRREALREHYGKMKHPGRKLAKIVLIAIALIVANVALMFHLGFIHWA